jgi:hypothetical protein
MLIRTTERILGMATTTHSAILSLFWWDLFDREYSPQQEMIGLVGAADHVLLIRIDFEAMAPTRSLVAFAHALCWLLHHLGVIRH